MSQAGPMIDLKESCANYSVSIRKSLHDLLNISVMSGQPAESVSQLVESEDLYFSILFTGQVYGEFLFGLKKQTALEMLGLNFEPGQAEKVYWENRADILDAFKEVINLGAGQALINLKAAYPDVSITPPKAIEGKITLGSYSIERVKLVHPSGELSCYIYIDYMKLDITEAMEKNKRLNQAKSEFLANMSHELRTPLNGMIGMLDILKSTIHSPVQKEQFEVVYQSGEFLLSLITDILEFSKIESGKLEISQRKFDLGGLLDSIVESLSPSVFNKGLDFSLQICPKIPTFIVSDETRIRQILINLIGNAVKFTPTGVITLKTHVDSASRLHFEIQDTGIGIPQAKLQTIFESFAQVDVTDTRKYGGTGLGLTITKSIVAALGGELKVQSQEAVGTQFQISIPIQVCAETELINEQKIDPNMDVVLLSRKSGTVNSITSLSENLSLSRLTKFDAFDSCTLQISKETTVLLDLSFWKKLNSEEKQKLVHQFQSHNPYVVILSEPRDLGLVTGIQTQYSLKRLFFLTLPISDRRFRNVLMNRPVILSKAVEPESNTEARHDQQKGKILVAEDNPINQKVISSMIKKLDYEFVIVPDGNEAVNKIKSGDRFDLILMDCQMPNMDGYEATKQIREFESNLGRHTRIVALTANAFRETKEECFACGMDDFATKPMTLESLKSIFERLTNSVQ